MVVAPPGAGKSTLLRQLIAEQLHDPLDPLLRVLWATRSIHGLESLGEEARGDFVAKKVDTQVVLPTAEFRSAGKGSYAAYAAQFDWPAEPQVKVVSHARVRQIFGTDHPLAPRLASADLLVIDEDPFSGLSLHSPAEGTPSLGIEKLTKRRCAVGLALERVAESATLTGSPAPFRSLKKQITGHQLSGPAFWSVFLAAHPDPVDVASLTATLKTLKVQEAAQIALAFAQDAETARHAPDNPPLRFGLDWAGRNFGHPRLRFNLLVPLTFDLPVLVLDGYADERYYQAMFPGHKVRFHHFDPGAQLEIEYAPKLKLEEVREGTTLQVQHRTQIAEELALLYKEGGRTAVPRPMLLLTSKRLKDENSQWMTFLQKAFEDRGLDTRRLKLGHWHAGRGSNSYAGADVYALHRPYLNRRHKDYQLTALYPQLEQAEERQRMDGFLIAAEALQMLHRGRQTRVALGLPRPRVVFALDLEKAQYLLAPFKERVKLSEYTYRLSHTRGSNNPRWRDGMTVLVKELLVFFPKGLPRSLLESLPLHKGENARKDRIRAQLEALAKTCPATSALHLALCRPGEWPFASVTKAGSGSDRAGEQELMEDLGLHLVRVTGRGKGKKVYYVPDTSVTKKAQEEFEEWLRVGTLPSPGAPASTLGTPALLSPTAGES